MRVSDKALERAARAQWEARAAREPEVSWKPWEQLPNEIQQNYLEAIAPLVEAAAPSILADGYRMIAKALESDAPKGAPWAGAPIPAPEVLRMAAKVLEGKA